MLVSFLLIETAASDGPEQLSSNKAMETNLRVATLLSPSPVAAQSQVLGCAQLCVHV